GRRPCPAAWEFQPRQRPSGRLVYLRRSNGQSEVTLFGRTWLLGEVWPHRLVRAEVDLDKDKIRFFRLRRRQPGSQPQILEVDYRLPNRGFRECSAGIGTCRGVPRLLFRMYWHLPHNSLGLLLVETGRSGDAEREFRAAVDLQQKVATDFPAVPEYRSALATNH